MRDVIWTIIIIWVIYKIIDMFRANSQKKSFAYQKERTQAYSHSGDTQNNNKKDIKSAIHKSADKEGEYVDYEEIK